VATPIDARRERAAARLAASTGDCWHFAILGLECSLERFDFDPAARLERVEDPPTEAELRAAVGDPRVAAALGPWAPALRWELVVDRKLAPSPPEAFHLAWLIGSALRIRTDALALVAAFADHSWSTIAAITGGQCLAHVSEDVPLTRRGDRSVTATLADLEWTWPRLADLAELLESARFRLSVDAIASPRVESNPRLAAVLLWAGVDALLACGMDQRFRLAASLAALLEPRGPARQALYEAALELDAMRERVVLSEMVSQADVEGHVGDVRALLRRLLVSVVDARRLPTADDFGRILLH
jgi:hypothetical protein